MDQVLKNYIDATNSHDFNNLIPLISEDAYYLFGDKKCSGIDAIRAYFEHAWHLIKEEIYNAVDIKTIYADEHTKLFVYRYTYEGYYQGKFVSGQGRATNVFIKENGRFVLYHEHLSQLTEHNF